MQGGCIAISIHVSCVFFFLFSIFSFPSLPRHIHKDNLFFRGLPFFFFPGCHTQTHCRNLLFVHIRFTPSFTNYRSRNTQFVCSILFPSHTVTHPLTHPLTLTLPVEALAIIFPFSIHVALPCLLICSLPPSLPQLVSRSFIHLFIYSSIQSVIHPPALYTSITTNPFILVIHPFFIQLPSQKLLPPASSPLSVSHSSSLVIFVCFLVHSPSRPSPNISLSFSLSIHVSTLSHINDNSNPFCNFPFLVLVLLIFFVTFLLYFSVFLVPFCSFLYFC